MPPAQRPGQAAPPAPPPPPTLTNQQMIIAQLLCCQKILGHDESWITNPPSRPQGGNTNDADMAFILSWMAQCFVHDELGDVVAVGAAVAKPLGPKPQPGKPAPPIPPQRKIIIMLSSNKGKDISKSDKEFATAFIKAINDMKGNTYTNANIVEGVNALMKVTVQYGWSRILSKITNIGKVIFRGNDTSETVAAFNAIIDLWASGQKPVFIPADFPEQGKLPDLVKKVKDKMQHIVAPRQVPKLKPDNVDMKLKYLQEISNDCKYVLQVIDSIMKRYNMAPPPLPENMPFKILAKFHRRMWRVLRYTAGAQKFLTVGLGLFKTHASVADMGLLTFEAEWIADNMPKAAFPDPKENIELSYADFKLWFDATIINATPPPRRNVDRIKFARSVVNRLCDAGPKNNTTKFTWKPRFHCEIALILNLEVAKRGIIGNIIGVGKLNCLACHEFVQEFSKRIGKSYMMTGTSGKAYHQWFIPPSTMTDQTLKDACTKASKHVYEKTLQDLRDFIMDSGRRNSQGSDSSTGSGGMTASDVIFYPST